MEGSTNKSGLAYADYDCGHCHYYLGLEEKRNEEWDKAVVEWQKAEKLLAAALEINIDMRGALAIDTIDNQECLSDVYQAMSREFMRKSLAGYSEARTMAENLLGKNSSRSKKIEQKILEQG